MQRDNHSNISSTESVKIIKTEAFVMSVIEKDNKEGIRTRENGDTTLFGCRK